MSNRRQFYFRQKVQSADLNGEFDNLEAADRALIADLGLVGLSTGLSLTQAALPNLTLLLGAGVAYDKTGRRVALGSNTLVDCSKDENGTTTAVSTPGNTRWVSIFLGFIRAQTDPKSVDDGFGGTTVIYYNQAESWRVVVAAGGEGATPSRPPLRSDMLLLGDVQLTHGQTAILTSEVNLDRREWTFKTATGTQIAVGTLKEALQLLADGVGAVVALSDNVIDETDDGASRVGFAVDNDGTTDIAQGTVRSAILSVRDALTAHVNDTTGAHAASAISYATSGNWKDGTKLSSTEVESALDEVVSDLADSAASATSGAAKVGLATRSAWKDGTTNPATSVQAGLEKVVVDLSADTGAAKVGYNGGGAWADGTTNPATSVEGQLDKIVTDLGGATGAAKIGATASGNLAATTVQGQLNELDSEKVQATTLAATGGAALVGATAGGGLSSTTVQGQLTELDSEKMRIDSLSASTGTTLVGGAAKSGMTHFNLAAGTVKAQLEELLTHVNTIRPDSEAATQPSLNTNLSHGPNGETLIHTKDGCGYMHVYGSVVWGGSGTFNGVICNLAAGRRPNRIISIKAHGFDPLGMGADALVWAYIDTTGNISMLGAPTGYIIRLAFPAYKAV